MSRTRSHVDHARAEVASIDFARRLVERADREGRCYVPSVLRQRIYARWALVRTHRAETAATYSR